MAILDVLKPKKASEQFIAIITQACLDYMCRRIPQKNRDKWVGQTTNKVVRDCTRIDITLTHECGYTVSHILTVGKGDFSKRSETAAQQRGVAAAKELIRKMYTHTRGCDGKEVLDDYAVEKRPGQFVKVPPPYLAKDVQKAVHDDLSERELAKKADERKRKKERKELMHCPICGECDDKTFPPWEPCEHVQRNKRPNNRPSKKRAKGSGKKVRRTKARAAKR